MVRRPAALRPEKQSFTRTPEEIVAYMPVKKENDFDNEIKNTRSNDVLMAALRSRAHEPATVSLQEIRKRLALD
jgi:hypothetical protein